jgi:hypothetical protein
MFTSLYQKLKALSKTRRKNGFWSAAYGLYVSEQKYFYNNVLQQGLNFSGIKKPVRAISAKTGSFLPRFSRIYYALAS